MYDVVFIGEAVESGSLNSLQIDSQAVLQCKGQVGDFTLRCREKSADEKSAGSNGKTKTGKAKDIKAKDIKTKAIVVNVPHSFKASIPDLSLFTEEIDAGEEKTIIFIQDYEQVAPAYINKIGMEKALQAARQAGDKHVYYFYRSLRFPQGVDATYEAARRAGVAFFRYEPGSLKIDEGSKISYQRSGNSLELEGRIFAAPKVEPAAGLEKLSTALNISANEAGYLQVENVYLAPTLTGRRGVYVLGGSRGPNALTGFEAEKDFTLHEIKNLAAGIQPLTSDDRVIDEKKCILCYTCYRICAHAALQEDKENDCMGVLANACWGCNGCISHCPAGAISINDEKVEKKRGNLVLMCKNSAALAGEKLPAGALNGLVTREIPCACSVKKEDIFEALQNPNDRVLVLGCFEESCKHLVGDRRGQRITDQAKSNLAELDLGEDRVMFKRLSPPMEEDLNNILIKWMEGRL